MTWFEKIIPSRIKTERRTRSVPEGLWMKCPACDSVLYRPEVERNLQVCPKCAHHMRIGARERLTQFLDPDNTVEIGADVTPEDPLRFRDTKRYRDRLAAAQKAVGERDALVVLSGTLEGIEIVAGAFEFSFMGGSMGSVVGGGSFSIARDGAIAYSANAALAPAEVGLFDGGKTRRLTNLNADVLAERELGAIEEIWSTSAIDGRRVQSWIIRPPGYDASKKYPLVLEIHGGPFANYGPRFAAELQLYAAAGYVVLFSNPRGSTSYGEEFGNLIHHAYPGRDYDDLMSAVDATIAKGGIDESRLFVTGGSGGGVLTAWIVGTTDRFRAAAVQKPVINWASFVLTADLPNFFYKYWFSAPPWEDYDAYWQRSPLSRVGNVKTPTMVVTGEQDYRTPISESEQFYQALRLRGVDTLLVRVPGAPHALDQRPSQLIARVAYILGWFAKHDPAAPKPPSDPSEPGEASSRAGE